MGGIKYLSLFFIPMVFLFLIQFISALGLTPAIIEKDFSPNFEEKIIYKVSDTFKEIKIYAQGDLAEYVEFDKEKLDGRGEFTATLKLPAEIKKSGKHRIFIVVEEVIEKDEEAAGSMIGTSIIIKGVVDINVPYSRKYLEIFFSSHNANIGEPVNFELEITSWGKEDVIANPRIEIFSLPEQKYVETLSLKEREIKSRETIRLKKTLDTLNYKSGNYKAAAIVDYGETAKAESEFRIGELAINIVSYTKQIIIGGFQPFEIEIESRWNDKIDGAFAEVFILNNSEILADFKTSSTELIPWERKNITGYFDTTNFNEGIYDANITLIYYGREVGKSSSVLTKIEFIRKENNAFLTAIWILVILIIAAIFWILIKKYTSKNEKNPRNKSKK